jgi:hypothetical protein
MGVSLALGPFAHMFHIPIYIYSPIPDVHTWINQSEVQCKVYKGWFWFHVHAIAHRYFRRI